MTKTTVADDFDAWYADHHEPYRIRLLGKEWDLPASLPALVVLRYRRLMLHVLDQDLPDDQELTDTDLPDGFTVEDLDRENIVRGLVGDELVEQWLAAGMTEPHLEHVGQTLVARYVWGATATTEDEDEGGGEGKAPEPEKTTSSTGSSSSGASSKPAGKRSTAATSPKTS